MSVLKVGFLLLALTAVFIWIGSAVGGSLGVIIAFGLAIIMNIGSYWYSDKLVLKMTKAQPVAEGKLPELRAMVERLSERAGIPTPKLYVIDDPSPNAFATGRNPENGVVAVNTGLLQILDPAEVEGVIAHEIAHIRSRDTLTMAIVATLAGAIMMIATLLRFMAIFGGGGSDGEGGNPLALLGIALVAPLAAMLIQMGISRAREYEADKLGAEFAGSPKGLAGALSKLERGVSVQPGHTPPQAAHMCIVNPFGGRAMAGIAKLFSTHPPTEERIRRLNSM